MLVRFFSFRARTARPRWLAWFALTLGVCWLGAETLARSGGVVPVAAFAVLGVTAAKLATETVRRVHDEGQSGWWVAGVGVGVVALVLTAVAHWIGYGTDAVVWGGLILAGISTAALALRPGTRGANAHGDPPAPWAASGRADGKAGVLVAALFLAGGIGAGGAVLAWQDALARERDERMRAAERPAPAPSPSLTAGTDGPAVGQHDALTNDNAALSGRIDDLLNRGDAQ